MASQSPAIIGPKTLGNQVLNYLSGTCMHLSLQPCSNYASDMDPPYQWVCLRHCLSKSFLYGYVRKEGAYLLGQYLKN